MNAKTYSLTVLDTEGPVIVAAAEPAKRRRGRPLGSRTRTAHSHVTADEFAYLRAVAQGIDLTSASRQYLSWPGRMPERAGLERFTMELIERVRSGAEALEDSRQAQLMAHKLSALRFTAGDRATNDALSIGHDPAIAVDQTEPAHSATAPAAPSSAPPPSLEDFAAQFPEDMYSESELVEMYAEEYPAVESFPHAPIALPLMPLVESSEQRSRLHVILEAIDWLSEHLVVVPERNHRVEQWLRLNAAQRASIATRGVNTIGEMVDWIAVEGTHWHTQVPRFGVTRALALEAWFIKWDVRPVGDLRKGMSSDLNSLERPGMRPLTLAREAWPSHLLRGSNALPKDDRNPVQPADDIDALLSWHELLKRRSPSTEFAYRRAIERLSLWALYERGVALSSLEADHLTEFREFLKHPPSHWIQAGKRSLPRSSVEWRPLLRPLDHQSIDLTFAAVNSLYSAWEASGYIRHSPIKSLQACRPEPRSATTSSTFSLRDREIIESTLGAMPDSPAKRRIVATIALLENTGLQREELANATWRQIEHVPSDGVSKERTVFRRTGNGGNQEVRLDASTVQALELHRSDRLALAVVGGLRRFKHVDPAAMPLLGVLDDRWIATLEKRRSEAGDGLANSDPSSRTSSRGTALARPVNSNGRLSSSAIYALLKTFFKRCGESVSDDRSGEEIRKTFNRATMSWLTRDPIRKGKSSPMRNLT